MIRSNFLRLFILHELVPIIMKSRSYYEYIDYFLLCFFWISANLHDILFSNAFFFLLHSLLIYHHYFFSIVFSTTVFTITRFSYFIWVAILMIFFKYLLHNLFSFKYCLKLTEQRVLVSNEALNLFLRFSLRVR